MALSAEQDWDDSAERRLAYMDYTERTSRSAVPVEPFSQSVEFRRARLAYRKRKNAGYSKGSH
jgi:hypothetical protein